MSNIIDIIKANSSTFGGNPMSPRRVVLNALLFRAWGAMERAHSIKPTEVNAAERIQRAETEMEEYLTAFEWAAREYEVPEPLLKEIVEDFIEGRQRASMPRTEHPSKKLLKKLGFTKKERKKLLETGVPIGFKEKAEQLLNLGFTGSELTTAFKAAMTRSILRAKERVRNAFSMGDEFLAQAMASHHWSEGYQPPTQMEITAYNAIVRAAETTKHTVARAVIEDWSEELAHEVQSNHLELKGLIQKMEERYLQILEEQEQKERSGREVEPETVTRAEQDAGVRPAMH